MSDKLMLRVERFHKFCRVFVLSKCDDYRSCFSKHLHVSTVYATEESLRIPSCPSNPKDGTKDKKFAKLPDSSWDEMSWYLPSVEKGEVSFDDVFHHPAVREYVQSTDFVNYIYASCPSFYVQPENLLKSFGFFWLV